jgi:uncharacterized protein
MSDNPTAGAITEDDIAHYLANDPAFFERHAELLTAVQLQSGYGGRAVSLQERQAEMLREKIKSLERRIMEMVRFGNDNVVIADRLHRWTLAILASGEARAIPGALTHSLRTEFGIPSAGLRLWNVVSLYEDEAFAADVDEDSRTFVGSLAQPFCGMNSGFDVARWLVGEDGEEATAKSIAIVALRERASGVCFGALVLGSPDAHRFSTDMGTDFLERVGEIASAAALRLIEK